MAKYYFPLVITGLFLLVGCQSQQTRSTVVDSMPGAELQRTGHE